MTRLRRLALALSCVTFVTPLGSAVAETLVVNPDSSDTSADYRTISDALAAAQPNDTVLVRRGTYATTFTLKKDVTLQGEETAWTKLTGTVIWTNGATIQRFTFAGGGMALTAATSGTIRYNIFRGASPVALKISGAVQSAGNLVVANNTFFDNETALEIVNSDGTVSVEDNIFSDNTTAAVMDTTPVGTGPAIQGNHFFPETQATGSLATSGDPLFVNPSTDSADLDLHVKDGSPCEDRGAYSNAPGTLADPTPSPVTGVSSILGDQGTTAVTWDGNVAVGVSIERYAIRFRRNESAATAFTLLSTVDAQNPEPETYSETVDLTPAAPAGLSWSPMDGGLRLSWKKDPLADGYRVHIAASAGGDPEGKDVHDVLTCEVGELTNGTPYFVSVSSYAEGERFLTVTARSTVDGTPESRPEDDSSKVTLPLVESDPSAEKQAVPEKLEGYPALEDKGGCFLDTARLRALGPGSPLVAAVLCLFAVVLAAGSRRRRTLLWAGLALVAALPATDARAGWATSASAGLFYPNDPDWSRHFGERYMPDGKLSLGYLPVPQLEAGVDVGFRRDEGDVRTSSGQQLDASVQQTLSVLPVQAYLLLNLRWHEGQWLVPYVAGGYSRLYYWSEIDDGEKVRGHVGGYHGRVGLKLLLNGLDPQSARNVKGRVGVQRTYALVEAQRSWVNGSDDTGSELGGTSYYAGISLEF